MGIPGFGGAGGGGAGGFMSNLSPINLMTGESAKQCKPACDLRCILRHVGSSTWYSSIRVGEVLVQGSEEHCRLQRAMFKQDSTKASGTWVIPSRNAF
jgi:hypothetical protein